MLTLREHSYFNEADEMHYALLQSASRIGPNLHTHDFFEIVLLTDGMITHVVNGRQVTLRSGSLCLIRPADAHYYRPVAATDCRLINLAIAGRAIDDLFTYLGEGFNRDLILQPTLPPTVNLDRGSKQRIQAKLEQLQAIPPGAAARKRTTLRMLLFELITQYFPLVPQVDDNSAPAWLQQACAEMQRPENLALGVARMVDIASVSPAHLARTVRRYLRQTPTAYVNQLRLTYAANLLTHGDRGIVDIAADAGFESLSYFYTLFKVRYGQTPRQFRHAHQSGLPHAP